MKNLDPIAHVMTTDPKTVKINQKLSEARRMMTENQIHHVPVVSGRKLVGLISATDMLRLNIIQPGADSRTNDEMLDQQYTIDRVMRKNLVTIQVNESVRKASLLLSDGAFHSLPVVDEDNNLIGIITSTDLIRYLATLC